MVDRYSTMAGLVQFIFIIAMILLIATKWETLGPIMRILSLIGLSLFTVIQPLFFYANAGKSIHMDAPETSIDFSEQEMIIEVGSHIQRIPYTDILQVIKKPFMLIIQPDQQHIYILTDRILGNTKKDLYEFLKTKLQ